ncbi:MAG TPA: alpha/beta hydrolase, partial [Candidatus Binatus sp.]|nr:alpha/beta hydrolase [Candidatus Binatus sp.]
MQVSCAQTGQYTSKDLTILPCEQKANEFFFPLEFDEAGSYVYEDQAPAIEKALLHTQRVFVFIHGWNKTPKLAEGDYQDLICRFYTHSKHDPANAKKSIIIGVFWPSADFPPLLNFWRMKNRADDLAVTGFQNLMNLLANPEIESGGHQDLVLIGHSFGGRIILRGLTHYIAQLTPERYRFIHNLNQLQLILL